ncbi:MAG: hypothetical protein KGN00_12745 [Chloroflexota bacterium]|nr:hypothetical protein [Chloroflexota bacterium]
MDVRKLALASGAFLGLLASACTAQPPAVQGVQNPPGGSTVVSQVRADPALTEGMLPGSSSYIGASADGSLIGFLTWDGYVKWYRTH